MKKALEKKSVSATPANAASYSVVARIKRNITVLAVVPLVLAALALTAFAYTAARNSLSERVVAQLTTVRTSQANAIERYFENLGGTLQVTASTPGVIEAVKAMSQSFPQLKTRAGAEIAQQRTAVEKYYSEQFAAIYAKRAGKPPQQLRELLASLSDETIAAQYLYLANNNFALGKKNDLVAAIDGSDYSKAHATIQEFFGALQAKFGFYDFFLVDPVSGTIVYSYFKEIDFGTSLLNGPYSKSALARAFENSTKTAKRSNVWMSDYEPYYPSFEDQAAFMSVPVMDGERMVGVLLAQVPVDRVNKEMTFSGKWEDVGLGASGETYLVGSDSSPRSIGRRMVGSKDTYLESLKKVLPEPQIKAMTVSGSDVGIRRSDIEGVRRAVAGETGVAGYVDAIGEQLLGAYQPVKALNQRFGLVAEIRRDEALFPLTALLRNILLASLAVVLVMGGIGYYMSTRVAKLIEAPVGVLKGMVDKLNAGDFSARSKLQVRNEFGELGRALDHLLDDRLASMNQAAKDNDALNNSVIDIMQVVGTIATTKDLAMRIPVGEDITGAISDALNMLTDETGRVLKNVSTVSHDVAQASAAVKQQSENASNAANREQFEVERAAVELSSAAVTLTSMAERARLTNEGAERAVLAAGDALRIVDDTIKGVAQSRDLIRETEKRIKRLGERSQEIGQVVTIIQAIAERTGILALNASMHAASAGEAGRSFAVVADEVKRLSESAREATGQIGRLVTAIQTETGDTVVTMNLAISQVVEINRLADSAGAQMQKNQKETELLASSVREIARTSIEQAQVGAGLQERARIIQEASSETARQLSAQSEETEKLVLYAKSLLDEVSVFKLPA